jgi:Ca2+-binding EF-hand superfamily protein
MLFSEEKMKMAFKLFDADGNGKISKQELHKMMSGLDLKDIQELIQMADSNGDGEIDFQEFSALLRKRP